MKHSKHHKWQTRWVLDAASGIARHESGIEAQHTPSGPSIINRPAAIGILCWSVGERAAADRLARLTREAGAIFDAGGTFRARLRG